MMVRMFALALCLGTAAVGAPALAEDMGDPWLVRLRAIGVLPDEDASVSAPVLGSVDVDDSIVPELDISYFLTEHVALELILATTNHEAKHDPTGTDLGDVWLLPPTLTAQYHFMPRDPLFRPYIGAGINYTIFYGADAPGGLSTSYDDGFGFALQAGVDIPIDGGPYMLNIDVKKLWLSTDVKVQPLAGVTTADLDIDPWIVGIGIGRRF
jgi:outer membrane protein